MQPGTVLVVAGVACVFAAILAAVGAFILARRAAKWLSAGLALVFVLASVGLFIRAPFAPANALALAPVSDGLTLISTVDDSGGATISALSARDGSTPRWRHSIGDTHIEATPIVQDGVIYLTDQRLTDRRRPGNDGDVYALRLADGSTLWHITFLSSVLSAPTVADGHVYVEAVRVTAGSPDRQIVALDAATGKELWRHSDADTFFSPATRSLDIFFSPATHSLVAGGGLFITGGGAGIVALRATDGQIVWTVPLAPDVSLVNLTISGDMVLVLPAGGPTRDRVTALRLADGAPLWTILGTSAVSGAFTIMAGAFAVADGALYITVRDDSAITNRGIINPNDNSLRQFVYAFALRDGSLRWRYPIDDFRQSMASNDDTLFVSTQQTLYALRLTDGSVLWHRDGSYNTLLAAPGALFAISTAVPDGFSETIQFSALSLHDGSPYWNVQPGTTQIALAGA